MKYSMNLATRSYVNRRTLYFSYAVLGALLLVVLLFNLYRLVDLSRDIDRSESNIRQIEARLLARSGADAAGFDDASYRQALSRVRDANAILARDSFRWTSLLDRLEQVVPRQVRIVQIDPDHKEQVVKISGQAKSLKAMKRFIDNLVASQQYRHVLLENQSKDSKLGVIKFAIILEGAF